MTPRLQLERGQTMDDPSIRPARPSPAKSVAHHADDFGTAISDEMKSTSSKCTRWQMSAGAIGYGRVDVKRPYEEDPSVSPMSAGSLIR
jgi:hypothetical protein